MCTDPVHYGVLTNKTYGHLQTDRGTPGFVPVHSSIGVTGQPDFGTASNVVTSTTSASSLVAQDSTADLERIYNYATHIVDKRYELYAWIETKLATLVTIDGILLAAVFLLATHAPRQRIPFVSAEVEAVGCLLISLVISLRHTRPMMDSRLGINNRNPQSSIGIHSYKTHDEYLSTLLSLDLMDMVDNTARQIRAMNLIIWRVQVAIKRAGMASILSLIGLTVMVGLVTFA